LASTEWSSEPACDALSRRFSAVRTTVLTFCSSCSRSSS